MTIIEKIKDSCMKAMITKVGNLEAEKLLSLLNEGIQNVDILKKTPMAFYVPFYLLDLWEELSEETRICIYLTACVAIGEVILKSSKLTGMLPEKVKKLLQQPKDKMKMI